MIVWRDTSAVNPADWKARSGLFGTDIPLPLTLGFDFSGVIDTLVEGVTRWWVSDEVYGYAPGAYAEYFAVKESMTVAKPKSVDQREHLDSDRARPPLVSYRSSFAASVLRA